MQGFVWRKIRREADDCDDEDYDDDFIGGYATKLSDDTIVITFGKNAEDRIKKLAAQQ